MSEQLPTSLPESPVAQRSFFESLKDKLNYFNPLKILSSLYEALKASINAKDKNLLEKVGLFYASFKEKMKGLKKEKEQITAETDKKIKQGVDGTLTDAKKALNLDQAIDKSTKTDGKTEVISQGDKETVDVVLATSVKHLKSLDSNKQKSAYDGLDKLDAAIKDGKINTLTYEEASAIGNITFKTLADLRKKYSSQSEFNKMLETVQRVSKNSKYPLGKFLNVKSGLGVFKIKDEGESVKFLKAIGISPNLEDLVGKGPAKKAGEILESIAKPSMTKDEEDRIVNFMEKHIFKKSGTDVRKLVKTVNTLAVKGEPQLNTSDFTELVFCVHPDDFENLATILGKNV